MRNLKIIAILFLLCSATQAQSRAARVDINLEALPGMFQFIDRIVRPCSSGTVPLASVIVNPNNTGNVNVTPCQGKALTVNGVAVVPGLTPPGGANTQVQFNDSGAFGGDAGLTYVKATDALTVVGPLAAQSLALSGTAGAGFINFLTQSANPAAPASGYAQFADSIGRLSWRRQSDGFIRTFDATLTADRVYTLPNATGNIFTSGATNTQSTGQFTSTVNGALSTPAITATGTWITGGSATTTKPYFLLETTGATSTGWSTNGTGLGVNAASGFTGNLFDAQLNGTTIAKITSTMIGVDRIRAITATTADLQLNSSVIGLGSAGYVSWNSNGDGSGRDTTLSRNAAGVFQFGTTANNSAGTVKALTYTTDTNCADSAGAAACGSASAGSVVIDAGATSVIVSTTSVTANSQIFVQYDSSLGARLSVTCNVTVALPAITARTAATSFTITVPVAPTTNPACYSYRILN